jgi:hypothetical protein
MSPSVYTCLLNKLLTNAFDVKETFRGRICVQAKIFIVGTTRVIHHRLSGRAETGRTESRFLAWQTNAKTSSQAEKFFTV